MNSLKSSIIAILLLSVSLVFAQQENRTATVECNTPGSLSITPELVFAETLKVKGNINAIDLATLKTLRNSIRVLDLSEAHIEGLEETGYGTLSYNSSGDISFDPRKRKTSYPENYIPVHIFTSHMSNTIYKWYEGSNFVHTLVLPRDCEGFMKDALLENKALRNIVVPEGSTALIEHDGAVFDIGMTNLLMLPNVHPQGLDIPETVTTVSEGAISGRMAYLKFHSATPPTGIPADVDVAYIIAPNPEAYKEAFPGIDVISEIEEIKVDNVSEGNVLSAIISLGYTANNIRSVTLSGTASTTDISNLLKLPNLHYADLSNVIVTDNNAYIEISGKICDLKLPQGACNFNFISSYINGDLVVPEGTLTITCATANGMNPSSIIGGKALQAFNCPANMPNLLTVDLGNCAELQTMKGGSGVCNLQSLVLPRNLVELNNVYDNAQIHEIEIPETVEQMSVSGWMVSELRIPDGVKKLTCKDLRYVEALDLKNCKQLSTADLLSNCPRVKQLDLSHCPVTELTGFSSTYSFADENKTDEPAQAKQNRLISAVSGNRHPAPLWCGVEEITMPSTLKNLRGDCPQMLETLDLTPCYQLLKYEYAQGDNLKSIKLPASLESFYINEEQSFVNVEDITLGASTPPTLPEYADLSNIMLRVPNGLKILYMSTPIWWSAKEISEVGYSCSLSADKENVVLYGNGLHQDGTLVHVSGENVIEGEIEYCVKSWTDLDTGESFSSNDIEIPMNAHKRFFAYYGPVQNMSEAANLVLKIEAEEETTLHVYFIGEDLVFFRDNEPITPHQDYSNYYLPLIPGMNEYAVSGRIESFISEENTAELREISTRDCPTFVNLKVSGASALSRIDLSGCPNIEMIIAHKCGLETLVFPETTYALNALYVYGNKLTELNIPNREMLDCLKCYDNQIAELDLSYSDNLRWIDVKDNPLTKLYLNGCTSLEFLYLDSSPLESLEVANCESMTDLYCYENKLTQLDLSGCYALESLYCFSNQLESLNVADCTELLDLSAHNNKLTDLDVSSCSKLSKLSISNNSIKTLSVNPEVEYEILDIRYNQFTFSSVSDNMREYLKNRSGFIEFNAPIIDDGRTIDLSHELTAWNGTPSTITIYYPDVNGYVYDNTSEHGGVYNIPDGCPERVFYITITNETYPGIEFCTHYNYIPGEVGIETVHNKMQLTVNGLQVSSGRNAVSIYNLAGEKIAEGVGSVSAPSTGTYIIKCGENSVKLQLGL